ncbi:MAG: hypothetical protein DIU65_07550 [Proteobacteria bacterium]|nr:MAG: hypothetical protein DIU65_07550 [Pseudomonadota bacterium]
MLLRRLLAGIVTIMDGKARYSSDVAAMTGPDLTGRRWEQSRRRLFRGTREHSDDDPRAFFLDRHRQVIWSRQGLRFTAADKSGIAHTARFRRYVKVPSLA